MGLELISKFEKVASWWRVVEQTVLAVLVSGMVFLAATQIILRNFFGTGLSWAEPILGVALLWLTMIGALVATGARKHINIDLFSQLLSERRRWLVVVPVDLFAAVICTLLGLAAIRYVGLQQELEPALILNIPLWQYYKIIPVCLFLMSFRFAVQALSSLMRRGNVEGTSI
jgi:TRAP-type C4-dicarboxylate transport system permease small subunit